MKSLEVYETLAKIIDSTPKKMRPVLFFAGASSVFGYYWYQNDKKDINDKFERMQTKIDSQDQQIEDLKRGFADSRKEIWALREADKDRSVDVAKLQEKYHYLDKTVGGMKNDAETFKKYLTMQELLAKQRQIPAWKSFAARIIAAPPEDSEKIFRTCEKDLKSPPEK